jgi:hypothetical protein
MSLPFLLPFSLLASHYPFLLQHQHSRIRGPHFLHNNIHHNNNNNNNCARSRGQEVISFYIIWSFITVFTKVLQWKLSWPRWIQSTQSYSVPLRSILMLSLI